MAKIMNEETNIHFDEGLIGLPNLRETLLKRLPEFEPFFWLASAEDANVRFLIVESNEIFPNYQPVAPPEVLARLSLNKEEKPLVFSLVQMSSDWTKTRVNLRAPLFINAANNRGAQAILPASEFRLDETLPANLLEN